MYAEAGLLFPYFQGFSQEIQHLEEFCCAQKSNAEGVVLQACTLPEYDLGAEGDLFKAPEPINTIMEESVLDLDHLSVAVSMITGRDDVISVDPIQVPSMDSTPSDPLLNEVFYECNKDFLAQSSIEDSFNDILDIKIPCVQTEEDFGMGKGGEITESPIQKSVSSGCLTSVDWINGGPMQPSFLDFQGVDLGVFGMRRAFSEGDIQTLGNVKTSVINSFEQTQTIGNYSVEERKQRLSRYRKKRSKRNFGRKIKYACRKALADSQPRIRGRFAKTEEAEVSYLRK